MAIFFDSEIKIFQMNKKTSPPRKLNINIFKIRVLKSGSLPDEASELMADANPEKNPIDQINNLVLKSLEPLFSSDKNFNYPFYLRKTTLKHCSLESLNTFFRHFYLRLPII